MVYLNKALTVYYYREEWRRPGVQDALGFTAKDEWKVFVGSFVQNLAGNSGGEYPINHEKCRHLVVSIHI